MGGGASKRKRKGQNEADGVQANYSGAKTMQANNRRRTLLLGAESLKKPMPFEQVEPMAQFDKDDDDSIVFERFGAPENIFKFREESRQISSAYLDGLLRPHAIEKLCLGIKTGSEISKRLFNIGLVGRNVPLLSPQPKDEPKKTKRENLTCYELMALYAIIRYGTRDELLELIFCVFDVDEDDKVSVQDFQATIVSYLEADEEEEARLTGLEGKELQAYRSINKVDKTKAALQAAEIAVGKYGSAKVDLEAALSEGEVAEPDQKGKAKNDKKASAKAAADKENSGKENSKETKKGGFLSRSKSKDAKDQKKDASKDAKDKDEKKKDANQMAKPLLHDEEESEDEGSYESGKKKPEEDAKPKGKAKAKSGTRCGCFGGKKRQQDGSDTDAEKKEEKDKEKDSKHQSDDSEDDSGIKTSKETEGGKKEEEKPQKSEEKSKDSKAAAKKAAKEKTGCFGRSKKKPSAASLPPLTFEQWKEWFDDSFPDFTLPDRRPSVAMHDASSMKTQAGVGMLDPGAGYGGVEGQRIPSAGANPVRGFSADDDEEVNYAEQD